MRRLAAVTVLALGAGVVPLTTTSASAIDNVDTKKFRDAVTVNGILGHERALQRIANQNGGTRASGTPGYTASVDYVRGRLEAAGYTVQLQEFTFPFFRDVAAPTLAEVSPTAKTFQTHTFTYSGSGTVTGRVVPTNDIQVPPNATPSSSTSGCEASDFVPASATEPQVALVQRGTCTFETKATNARAAGYDAVIIVNEGQEGRTDLLQGTLNVPFDLPVIGLSYADGAELYTAAKAGAVTLKVTTSTESNPNATTVNVLADTKAGDPDKVVVVGAHLDSVPPGPGINDNGSGTSTLLEIAEQLAKTKVKPRQKVRFAFWGAEEFGLLGSTHYVSQLTDAQLGQLYANLNVDMVGSPNYVRFVYDGDGSDTPTAGPPGSAQIESLFTAYFTAQKLPTEPTAFDGRSDYGPFIAVGVPAGGLFSGAEGVKTAAEAATYGGKAGVAYDSCYHQACDTTNNLSTKALNELGDAAAHATLTLALTKTGFFEDNSRVARRTQTKVEATKGPFAVR